MRGEKTHGDRAKRDKDEKKEEKEARKREGVQGAEEPPSLIMHR